MNKYFKLAIVAKLKDYGIEVGETFKIEGWNDLGYIYNG